MSNRFRLADRGRRYDEIDALGCARTAVDCQRQRSADRIGNASGIECREQRVQFLLEIDQQASSSGRPEPVEARNVQSYRPA